LNISIQEVLGTATDGVQSMAGNNSDVSTFIKNGVKNAADRNYIAYNF